MTAGLSKWADAMVRVVLLFVSRHILMTAGLDEKTDAIVRAILLFLRRPSLIAALSKWADATVRRKTRSLHPSSLQLSVNVFFFCGVKT